MLQSGGAVEQVNMGWDEERQRNRLAAHQGKLDDYRYFLEAGPAAAGVEPGVGGRRSAERRASGAQARARYIRDQPCPTEADALTGESLVACFFEGAVAAYGEEDGKARMANWITGELFRPIYADGEDRTCARSQTCALPWRSWPRSWR